MLIWLCCNKIYLLQKKGILQSRGIYFVHMYVLPKAKVMNEINNVIWSRPEEVSLSSAWLNSILIWIHLQSVTESDFLNEGETNKSSTHREIMQSRGFGCVWIKYQVNCVCSNSLVLLYETLKRSLMQEWEEQGVLVSCQWCCHDRESPFSGERSDSWTLTGWPTFTGTGIGGS